MLALLSLSACRIGAEPEPIPIDGPAPEVIAVWPAASGAEPPGAELWFTGLSNALSRRGYRVLPPAVTSELLRTSDLATAAVNEQGIGRALRADALLQLRVHQFEATANPALQTADWHLEWRLLSTRGLGIQWTFTHQGHYQQVDPDPFDPARSVDEHRHLPDLAPIGGPRHPNFQTPRDLLAHLHNQAIAHLPTH